MIEKICNNLVDRMKKQLPDMSNEKAEEINYGLQLIIGEIPKIFLIFIIGFALGVGELTVLTFVLLIPYRTASGGFHLKTHIGCIIGSTMFFCGIAYLSKLIVLDPEFVKYIVIVATWIFGMIMCKLYAPADTENVPILNDKKRKQKRIASYITLTITLLVAGIVSNSVISNILILATLFQSITITKLAYRITNNKYGHEVYNT